MAFDFYFAGTQCEEANEVMVKLNANVLKSYVNDKKEILKWFEHKKNGWKGKLLIDNGAFTFHRNGQSLDIDEYIKWLNENDDCIDYAIALDSIPGRWGQVRTAEDFKYSAIKTYENYIYMLDRVKSPQKILPVFHMGEDFIYLQKYLELKDLNYMCLSAFKDTINKYREDWYEQCFNLIKDCNRTDMKFHCLGSATIQNVEKFPFYSTDATSWIMSGANGSILTDKGAIYVGHKTILSDLDKQAIEPIVSKYGLTIDDVINDYKARMVCNVHYLYDKSRKTDFIGLSAVKRRLF